MMPENITAGDQIEIRVPSLMKNWLVGEVTLVTAEEVLIIVPGENVRFQYIQADGSWIWLSKYAGSVTTRPALLRWPTEGMLSLLLDELGSGEGVEDWARELVADGI